MYKIRKKQNYFSKDHNVELRCEKIIQIKGCEKFENDRQNDRKNDRRSRSDRITFFALSDRDLIGDHIFPSDRDLIGDHENHDRANLCKLSTQVVARLPQQRLKKSTFKKIKKIFTRFRD